MSAAAPRGARMLAVFAVALAINLATAAPTVVEGDGAELQTVAILGGIAHPTGYPTWTLCGRLFATVWPGEPARRITALSAVAGAAALVVLLRVLALLGAAPIAALAGVILIGASVTFRWSSIYPEVYALAVLLALIAVEQVIHAVRNPAPGRILVAATALSLAVTGHFLMAPLAAVLGLVLLMRGERAAGALATRAAMMIAGILLGLLPYLYSVWADAAELPMNYLRLVIEPGAGMFGLGPRDFDSAWERVGWLVFGAETRLFPYYLHPRLLAINGCDGLARVFLFDVGPAALVLAPLGAWTLRREHAGSAVTVMLVAAASFLFAISLTDDRMLLAFLIPFTLAMGLLSALGAGRLASAISRRPLAPAALTITIALVSALLPHTLRVLTVDHPIGPRSWRHRVEGGPELRGIVPRLDRAWESRRTAERAMELIPEGALVIARWREIMTLYYLRDVEGRRRDLTFDPVYRGHEARYARWQATHDLRERPFVLLGRSPEIEVHLPAGDSVAVTPQVTMYIYRQPMLDLPMP